MKAKLIIISLSLLLSNLSYGFGTSASCGCGGASAQRVDYCYAAENPCACTDPGWRDNYCISKSKFCAAFGNMGGLE